MGDQIFGAFLYSNACVVSGLQAAARLALLVGRAETSKRWQAAADRIWNEGHSPRARRRPESIHPGMIDPNLAGSSRGGKSPPSATSGRSKPEFLIDRSDKLDVSMLALAVPFRLLPAANDRLVKTAQAILRANNKISGDPDVLARFSYDPEPAEPELAVERAARSLEPGHALDGPLPDPAWPGDWSDPLLEPGDHDDRGDPHPDVPPGAGPAADRPGPRIGARGCQPGR